MELSSAGQDPAGLSFAIGADFVTAERGLFSGTDGAQVPGIGIDHQKRGLLQQAIAKQAQPKCGAGHSWAG